MFTRHHVIASSSSPSPCSPSSRLPVLELPCPSSPSATRLTAWNGPTSQVPRGLELVLHRCALSRPHHTAFRWHWFSLTQLCAHAATATAAATAAPTEHALFTAAAQLRFLTAVAAAPAAEHLLPVTIAVPAPALLPETPYTAAAATAHLRRRPDPAAAAAESAQPVSPPLLHPCHHHCRLVAAGQRGQRAAPPNLLSPIRQTTTCYSQHDDLHRIP